VIIYWVLAVISFGLYSKDLPDGGTPLLRPVPLLQLSIGLQVVLFALPSPSPRSRWYEPRVNPTKIALAAQQARPIPNWIISPLIVCHERYFPALRNFSACLCV